MWKLEITRDNEKFTKFYNNVCPECSWFMCLTSISYRLTSKLHNVQWNKLLTVWTRRCTAAPLEFKNFNGHNPQENGSSPVCSPIWLLRMFDVLNPFSQYGQRWGRNWVWVNRWPFNVSKRLNFLEHISHSNFITFEWVSKWRINLYFRKNDMEQSGWEHWNVLGLEGREK